MMISGINNPVYMVSYVYINMSKRWKTSKNEPIELADTGSQITGLRTLARIVARRLLTQQSRSTDNRTSGKEHKNELQEREDES